MNEPDDTRRLTWRCRCGEVTGVLAKRARDRHFRAVCHCRDCQAFQHAIGRTEDVLDAHGGTDIVGVTPAAFTFSSGRDRVRPLRLTPKGLLRWHTRCCDTPIGNTGPSRGIPHLGLTATSLLETNEREALDAVYGPITHHIHGKGAPGGSAPGAHPGVPFGMVPGVAIAMLARLARGEHRSSAFFEDSGEPIAAPRVLTLAEHDALAPYRPGEPSSG